MKKLTPLINLFKALAEGDIFLGIQQPLAYALQGQLGLAGGTTSSATLSGNIWDDADPEFNNYTYRYKIYHRYITLKTKLIANYDRPFLPWISASIGVQDLVTLTHFYNTPIIFMKRFLTLILQVKRLLLLRMSSVLVFSVNYLKICKLVLAMNLLIGAKVD